MCTREPLQRREEDAQLAPALAELAAEDRLVIETHFLRNSESCQPAALPAGDAELKRKTRTAIENLERAMRLLAEMERKAMPAHYRALLCARRIRGQTVPQVAQEFALKEYVVQGLLENAEAWMQGPGGIP
jgi:hypothetical protein